MIKTNLKSKSGFTLIELLTVIAIITLLISIVLVSIASAKVKAKDSALVEHIIQTRNAIELYKTDHGYYPGENFGNPDDFYYQTFAIKGHLFATTSRPTNFNIEIELAPYLQNFPEAFTGVVLYMHSIAGQPDGNVKCFGQNAVPSYVIIFSLQNPSNSNLPWSSNLDGSQNTTYKCLSAPE